jgi:tRNA (cmo5U34)-methyltransferase
MVEIALEMCPLDTAASFTALDLGIGTGFFSHAVLRKYPNCRVIGIDGAASMVEMAKVRLGWDASRVDFRTGDFRTLAQLLAPNESFTLAYSSYALHHLDANEKRQLLQEVYRRLDPGGWFLNGDLIVAGDPRLEERIQQLRVEGIVRRAAGKDPRFASCEATRVFLDDLEARDSDRPVTLAEDLEILRAAGFQGATAFWAEYREAVTGGCR